MKLLFVLASLFVSTGSILSQTLLHGEGRVFEYPEDQYDIPVVTDITATVPSSNTGEEYWILLGSFRIGMVHKLFILSLIHI